MRQMLVVLLLVLAAVAVSGVAGAQPPPGGSLDPLTIPKYVTPLFIVPEMPKSTRQPGLPRANYNIAVRQFKQQILPGGVWNSVNGRSDMFGATTVWSYGRAQDALPANFVAPAPLSNNVSFNYPALTVENLSGQLTKVRWINDLKDTSGKFLPHLFPVDQTLHWANPPATGCSDGTNRTDCETMRQEPYTGPVPVVIHVHGSHVNPESDGYPEAWWLPAARNVPAGYKKRGALFDQYSRFNTVRGSAFFAYENTQPATTLWYHDHALGMTRVNLYAGMAGFWLVRGGANGDDYVDDVTTVGTGDGRLPGPAPRGTDDPNFDPTVRADIREIPVIIQDRSFNTDGSLFYPSNRAFFEGLNVPGVFPSQFPGAGFLDIPFAGDPSRPSDIAPIWNPEAFFNTMVVNGTTWPQLEAAPALYRLRLLNGCNARFLNLALFVVDGPGPDGIMGTGDDVLGQEIPFFQIGADEGFLPKVAMIRTGVAVELPGDGTIPVVTPIPGEQRALLVGIAERADVIVDFRGLPNGTFVRMINTAPDTPFGGFPDIPSDPGTTGQVMQFVVNAGLIRPADALSTPPANLLLPAEARIAAPVNATRQLSLNEESSGQVCVRTLPDGTVEAIPGIPFDPANPDVFLAACATAGGVPFGPKAALLGTVANGASTPLLWMNPVTEKPILGDTEVWEIFNLTADGHPIHLHLVRFEVVERQALQVDAVTGEPLPVVDAASPATAPHPAEKGFKDTVVALPGQVTRIKATFDIPGLYVWHCHILEHEDNEMMRPYVVRVNPQFPDFNQDGNVNARDLSVLLTEIFRAPPRNPGFDLNNDGKVNGGDVRFFLQVRRSL